MYYLSKFCRICVETGVKLLDIDALDFDGVRLSEKLHVCSKLLVDRESYICIQCLTKLRVSYQFHDMCRKSTRIINSYLAELMGNNNDSTKISADNFDNAELYVSLTAIPCNKRKRITKEQRCSLLKQLLTTNEHQYQKDRSRIKPPPISSLRSIINFTRNFEFNYKLNEPTHIDKLTEFSNKFFQHDFSEFRDTILYIIENKDNISDSEEEFDEQESLMSESEIKCEEVVVEPDIKIKTEIEDYDDFDCTSSTVMMPSINNNNNCKFSAMNLLDNLVNSYSREPCRTFSRDSVRCRTRNNPYICPSLRQQFQSRSFQCPKCNRFFKSPGYLSAHNSKVHVLI